MRIRKTLLVVCAVANWLLYDRMRGRLMEAAYMVGKDKGYEQGRAARLIGFVTGESDLIDMLHILETAELIANESDDGYFITGSERHIRAGRIRHLREGLKCQFHTVERLHRELSDRRRECTPSSS